MARIEGIAEPVAEEVEARHSQRDHPSGEDRHPRSVAKLHPILSAPGVEHAITIEEPPADAPGGTQLPLI